MVAEGSRCRPPRVGMGVTARCPHPSGGVPPQRGSGQSFTLAQTPCCRCFSPVHHPDSLPFPPRRCEGKVSSQTSWVRWKLGYPKSHRLFAPRFPPEARGSEDAACTTGQPPKSRHGETTRRFHLLSPGQAPLSTLPMSSRLHRTGNNRQREKQGDLLLISKAL